MVPQEQRIILRPSTGQDSSGGKRAGNLSAAGPRRRRRKRTGTRRSPPVAAGGPPPGPRTSSQGVVGLGTGIGIGIGNGGSDPGRSRVGRVKGFVGRGGNGKGREVGRGRR